MFLTAIISQRRWFDSPHCTVASRYVWHLGYCAGTQTMWAMRYQTISTDVTLVDFLLLCLQRSFQRIPDAMPYFLHQKENCRNSRWVMLALFGFSDGKSGWIPHSTSTATWLPCHQIIYWKPRSSINRPSNMLSLAGISSEHASGSYKASLRCHGASWATDPMSPNRFVKNPAQQTISALRFSNLCVVNLMCHVPTGTTWFHPDDALNRRLAVTVSK